MNLYRVRHGQGATRPCLGMETASPNVVIGKTVVFRYNKLIVISDVEATTHTLGVAQPSSLIATFNHLVPLDLRVTTCMLATPTTVVTGNREHQAGSAKDLDRGSFQDMDREKT
jgi:hypothetical protein